MSSSPSVTSSGLGNLLSDCKREFAVSCENGDNKRRLVKCLQDLASQHLEGIDDRREIEEFLHSLWNCPVLLEDCILVSGIIFAKLNSQLIYSELFKKAQIHNLNNNDWIAVAFMRGILLDPSLASRNISPEQLEELASITLEAIDSAITLNRTVLVSRHLENILHIYTAESKINCYDPIVRGNQILSLVSRALRLNTDLTDYKSRDLVKWHLNYLGLQQNLDLEIAFAKNLLECLPEMNKISIQIFSSLSSLSSQDSFIKDQIFRLSLPCLKVKGGLGSAAANCITKLLSSSQNSNSSLLEALLKEIMELQCSRDIIKTFKLVVACVDEPVKLNIISKLKESDSNSMNQLLLSIVQDEGNSSSSALEPLLQSGDEFFALEAFNLLARENVKQRRKPATVISATELSLFNGFMDNVIFSGSVDFRQKVSVASKSFYEQVYGRIYFLTREIMRKPREGAETANSDKESFDSELDVLFGWLVNFIKASLVDPLDFCKSNFGSVDFAFNQILLIFSAFEGNATLVAANTLVLSKIKDRFRAEVIDLALIPAIGKFVNCVVKSTYDSLRIQAIEIICKCQVDASIVPVNDYIAALGHPRAINNEGAARIVLLHANLSKNSQLISSILNVITEKFNALKSNFPVSLHANNINGRLLLLRFLIQEQPETLEDADISKLIKLSVEISEFVSAVASHPSPEGLNLSETGENDHDHNEDEEENEDEDDLDEDPSSDVASSQFILSFSWRAVKETSSLLQTLLNCCASRISKDQVHVIADHFICLLIKLRHCGAFRSLQGPLSTALRLQYSFTEKIGLLKNVLEVCLGTGQITTTRRSAGLPFLILAVAHSCSGRANELAQLISNLVPPLLTAASSTDFSPSVVHAFNIIRSLVRDSKIAAEMGPHMAPIAKLCLESFNSIHWSVRNASAMLLSSLIARIFGPKHVNNLTGQDHHVDLREIEVKFEGLIEIITASLQNGIVDLEPRIAYPLLAVLERVRIPPHERFDDFRTAIISFLLELLQILGNHPENGRKLAHVLGRTVLSLLISKSLNTEDVCEKLLSRAIKSSVSTPNNVYYLLILIENVKLFDPSVQIDDFILPPINFNLNWHPILVAKYNQVVSHKYLDGPNLPEEKGTPAISISEELSKRHPNIQLICSLLQTDKDCEFQTIYSIIDKLRFNEEILGLALPILCQKSLEAVDERLKNLLTFYAAAENNENVRLIVVNALAQLEPELFKHIPQCVFSLLLDDNDEIRNEMCRILNSSAALNPAETLRKFISSVGLCEFRAFLDNYEEKNLPISQGNSKNCLFEKEPLNLFIDIQYLRRKFCQ